jgi:hypothetical protein
MATKKKSTRKKLTSAQIKEQTKKIQDAIDKHKREHRDENFAALTPEEIERKLKRTNSPMMVSASWGSAPPGGTFNYNVGILNPDPVADNSLYVHVWVGSGNVDPTVGTFLLNVDTRFPRLTEPKVFGLALAPGASSTLSFTIKVPTMVEKSNYLLNACLMRANTFDVGQYLDRGVFPFAVT